MIPLTIEKIEVSALKENEKISSLVPEMTEIEYGDFLQSIREEGIRTPIHIQEDMTILDGRHRVRACREMGITHIQAIFHNLSGGDAVKFATTTAVNRRNLTTAQRVDIALRCTELLEEIKRKAKKNRNGSFKGNQYTEKEAFVSRDTNSTEPIHTSEQIADISKTSRATVNRLLKIKREDEQKYDEVIKGDKGIKTAYNELPTVKARVEAKKTNELSPTKSIVEETEEDTEIFIATENLRFNANQIIGLVESYENLLEKSLIEFEKVEPQKVNELEISVIKILEAIKKVKGRVNYEES